MLSHERQRRRVDLLGRRRRCFPNAAAAATATTFAFATGLFPFLLPPFTRTLASALSSGRFFRGATAFLSSRRRRPDTSTNYSFSAHRLLTSSRLRSVAILEDDGGVVVFHLRPAGCTPASQSEAVDQNGQWLTKLGIE